ncbi:hypothetical protein [Caldiplasma sukawensis]
MEENKSKIGRNLYSSYTLYTIFGVLFVIIGFFYQINGLINLLIILFGIILIILGVSDYVRKRISLNYGLTIRNTFVYGTLIWFFLFIIFTLFSGVFVLQFFNINSGDAFLFSLLVAATISIYYASNLDFMISANEDLSSFLLSFSFSLFFLIVTVLFLRVDYVSFPAFLLFIFLMITSFFLLKVNVNSPKYVEETKYKSITNFLLFYRWKIAGEIAVSAFLFGLYYQSTTLPLSIYILLVDIIIIIIFLFENVSKLVSTGYSKINDYTMTIFNKFTIDNKYTQIPDLEIFKNSVEEFNLYGKKDKILIYLTWLIRRNTDDISSIMKILYPIVEYERPVQEILGLKTNRGRREEEMERRMNILNSILKQIKNLGDEKDE